MKRIVMIGMTALAAPALAEEARNVQPARARGGAPVGSGESREHKDPAQARSPELKFRGTENKGSPAAGAAKDRKDGAERGIIIIGGKSARK